MNFSLKTYLEGKRILVIGLGYSNVALIKHLVSLGIKSIVVTDTMHDKDELVKVTQNIDKVKEVLPDCRFVLGSHSSLDLSQFDLVIKSPSIENSKPFISDIVNKGIPIETDISLFFKILPREKIIGITGTKGKSTTTTLLYTVLREQGLNVTISGNIGIPVFDQLEKHQNADYVIVELSSFMNTSLAQHKLSPSILIVTSLNQDHLDFHGSVAQYIKDKMSIIACQGSNDRTYVNTDSIELMRYINENPHPQYRKYAGFDVEKLVTTKLRGKHYLSNISAVYQVSKDVLGDSFNSDMFIKTVKEFSPLHSRMETVGTMDNIEFINNSKATNTDAFCSDLTTLIAEQKSVFVLCGGEDKELDLTQMAKLLESNFVEGVSIFDNIGGRRLAGLINEKKIIGYYTDVRSAFNATLEIAKKMPSKPVVVILMPGTGTYGLFKNKDGSDLFNTCVREISS